MEKKDNKISELKLRIYFQDMLKLGKTVTKESLARYYFEEKGNKHNDWDTTAKLNGYDSLESYFFGVNENNRKYFSRAMKTVVDNLANNGIDIVCKEVSNGRVKAYRWPEDVPIERMDTLLPKIEEEKMVLEILQEVDNLIPETWFSKKLHDRIESKPVKYMSFDSNMNLKNLQLMPSIIDAVKHHKVIKFEYRTDSVSEPFDVILHPHFIKEYNNRWFILGYSTEGKRNPSTFPIDRIISEKIEFLKLPFVENTIDYSTYFKDIIGVTHLSNSEVEHLLIRTLNAYTHELIATKPFHDSQVETIPFTKDFGYGEFSLDVKFNNELIGKLFMYESNIKVITGKNSKVYKTLRYHIAEMAKLYGI